MDPEGADSAESAPYRTENAQAPDYPVVQYYLK